MNESIAVVTGTIVDFGRANTTMQTIAREKTSSMYKRHAIESYTIEGNAYIAVMQDPHDAMRLCLEHHAMLKQLVHNQHPKGLDAMMSIGLGGFDDSTNDTPAHYAAKKRAEIGLGVLKSRNGRLAINTGSIDVDALLGTTLRLLDRVVTGWSASQAAAMEYTLQGLTQHQIADILHITQPSVNNRLKLAQWNEIEHIIQVWEGLMVNWNDVEYLY